MTQAGTTPARRALVEGAWASRSPAQVSRPLPLRLEQHPPIIQDISWNAPLRLGNRYRRLVSRGKPNNVVTVAMARERAGFLWAMAKPVPLTPSGRHQPRPQTVANGHRKRRGPGSVSPVAA